jgi:hypothetical protein
LCKIQPEKEKETMLIKPNFILDFNLLNLVIDVCFFVATTVAIFSGLLISDDNLALMGIQLDSNVDSSLLMA